MPYMEVDILEVVCAGKIIQVKHSTYNTSYIYIYIYVYMCVCVCVCVCICVYMCT